MTTFHASVDGKELGYNNSNIYGFAYFTAPVPNQRPGWDIFLEWGPYMATQRNMEVCVKFMLFKIDSDEHWGQIQKNITGIKPQHFKILWHTRGYEKVHLSFAQSAIHNGFQFNSVYFVTICNHQIFNLNFVTLECTSFNIV